MDKETGTPGDEWSFLQDNPTGTDPQTSDWRFRKLEAESSHGARLLGRSSRRRFSSTSVAAPPLEERLEKLGWSVLNPDRYPTRTP
jgi:hypothetical protein